MIKNISNTTIQNLDKIEKWSEENGRFPRKSMKSVKISRNATELSEEQEELKLGIALNYIYQNIIKDYKEIDVEDIKDKNISSVVARYRRLEEIYQESTDIKIAREIFLWVMKNKRLPEHEKSKEENEIKGKLEMLKTKIVNQYKNVPIENIEDEKEKTIVKCSRYLDIEFKDLEKRYLKNIKEILIWAKENERLPRGNISNVKVAKKGEKETQVQKELRMGRSLYNIKTNVINKYENIPLNQIKDEEERKIIMIHKQLIEKYKCIREIKGKKNLKNKMAKER